MSNIMSMAAVKNKPSRNGFDLTCKNGFTAKIGELLPVLTKEVLPGDKFKVRAEWFTRTNPLQTAAFTRFREYYDFFFVPLRLLWRWSDNALTQMPIDNSATNDSFAGTERQANYFPWFSSADLVSYLTSVTTPSTGFASSQFNELGFDRAPLTGKLLDYLDYGNSIVLDANNVGIGNLGSNYGSPYKANDYLSFQYNLFPLAAYQKIYADYYRFDQWEKTNPSLYNFDYLYPNANNSSIQDTHIDISKFITQARTMSTLFDLRYCNWNKDLFHGVLPNSQFGNVTVVDTVNKWLDVSGSVTGAALSVAGASNGNGIGVSSSAVSNNGYVSVSNASDGVKSSFNFSILALRQAEFLQRWKEIANYGKNEYKHQIEQHWGVKMSNSRSSLCDFIGGLQSNLNINEVVNTNLTGDNSATIGGKSVGVGNGSIEFEAKEHGIFMCIYHCLPILDYASNGTDPLNFKVESTDYAIPEMDRVGMQLVPPEWLVNDQRILTSTRFQGDDYLGFAPRYIDYKTSVDKVHGDFNGTKQDWVAPLTKDILTSQFVRQGIAWDYSAMKATPSIGDSIFGVAAEAWVNTDQLNCNVSFDLKAVRNLDVNGLPY